MNIYPFVTLIVALCLTPTKAAQLPVVIELDRYLVEARQLIEQKAFTEAKTWLNKAKNLSTTLPPDFYYINAKYLFYRRNYKEANNNIIQYLNHTGRFGSHYNNALTMVTALEKKTSSVMSNKPPEKKQKPPSESKKAKTTYSSLEKKERTLATSKLKLINKIKSITSQKSYLILQNKINSLLKENAIFERHRVAEPTLVYSIRADHGGTLIITRSEHGMEGMQTYSYNIAVNRIPTQLNTNCSFQEQRCWLKHPLNNSRWLEINYNEKATEILTANMTMLIKEMQKNKFDSSAYE